MTASGRAALDQVINIQASIISYIDDFKLMMLVTFAVLPLLFLMRKSQQSGARPQMAMD